MAPGRPARVLRALLLLLCALHATNARAHCPSANQISPCMCKAKSQASCTARPSEDGPPVTCLDIVCEAASTSELTNVMTRIKQVPNSAIQYMKIRDCTLPRLTDYFFMSLSIKHLYIIRSRLAAVEENALTSLAESLVTIDFSDNSMKTIPTGAFRRLHRVHSLNLNKNHLESVGRQAFTGLSNMTRLSLFHNKISRVDDDAFNGLRSLGSLNLMENQLKKVPSKAIRQLGGLEKLELAKNRIADIKTDDFKGLGRLDALILQENQIKALPAGAFAELGQLTTLNLESNQISYIDKQAFRGLEQTLEWLSLGNNKVFGIPTPSLRNHHRLKQLDLKNNNISIIPEDAFEGFGQTIKFLYLQRNSIKTIPRGTFMQMHSLEWLKLSHNQIQTLPLETVENLLDTLTVIDLYENPLICDCDMIWFKEWIMQHQEEEEFQTRHHEPHCRKYDSNHVVSVKRLPKSEFNCPTGGGPALRGSRWQALLAALCAGVGAAVL